MSKWYKRINKVRSIFIHIIDLFMMYMLSYIVYFGYKAILTGYPLSKWDLIAVMTLTLFLLYTVDRTLMNTRIDSIRTRIKSRKK